MFALMIADTRPNGNEHFIVGRDAETVTGGALYRIPVPQPFWQLPPLSVKEDATHCAPTDASRLQQDFKVPEKPVELAVIAKLVPTKEMTTDSSNPTGKYNQINLPRELYFGQEGNLYAFYHAQSSGFRSGVAVWNMQTKRPVRARFRQYIGETTFRLKEGWGQMDSESQTGTLQIENLLTEKLVIVVKDVDTRKAFSTPSDQDTGEVFRVAEGHLERYASDGRRLKDVKTTGTTIAFAARNGRGAALYLNGNVQVWQFEPRGESKTYKLGLKLDDSNWAEELALSADGRYLRFAFPNASGDGPTQYLTYRLSSAKPVGNGELLSPFPIDSAR